MANGVPGEDSLSDVTFDDSGTATGIDSGDDDDGGTTDAPSELTGPGGAAGSGGTYQPDDPSTGTGAPEDDDAPSELTGPGGRAGTGGTYQPVEDEPLDTGGDLTETDQQFGPSGDQTSGFQDPDQLEGGLSGARFATEETTIGGETYQRGQAVPTETQVARQLEREAIEEAEGLGREDIAVTRTDEGFETDLTAEGEAQLQRQREFELRQARQEAQARQQAVETFGRQRQQLTERQLQEVLGQDVQRRTELAAAQESIAPGQRTQIVPGVEQTSTAVGTLAGAGEAITGPPGVIERELGYAVAEPVDAVTGAPGSVESAIGSFAFDVRDVSRGATNVVNEQIVEPTAPYVGEVAESIPLQPTALVPSESGGLRNVGTQATAEELAGEEDETIIGDKPETEAGQTAERFSEGAGRVVSESTVGLPAGAVEAGAAGAAGGEFFARSVEERGLVEGAAATGAAGYEFTEETAQAVAEQAQENPAEFAGMVAGGVVTSVVGGRAVQTIPRRARLRATTRGDSVDFEDLSTERAAQGDLPEFETPTDAPTEQAVRELRERAADQPEGLQQGLGERILYRSESERLPSDVDVARGEYELPGLFASPDASPLRLDIGSETSLRSFRPTLPNPFASPQRLSAFESPDIEGMPASATGSRIIRGPEGDRIPDPETGGARFLESEADLGTAYVRPTGSRTTELEAIFPPGSQFVRTTTRRVDIEGGEPATLDLYRRVEPDADDVDVQDSDLISREELIRRESRSGVSEGTPVTPTVPATTPTPTASQPGTVSSGATGVSPDTSPVPESRVEGRRRNVTFTEDVPTGTTTGTVGVSEGVGLTSDPSPTTGTVDEVVSPPTEPPSGPSSPPTSAPPSSPTSAPTSPPSSPPSSPFGRPSQPPRSPVTPPQTPTTTQPTRTPDTDDNGDDDEEFYALFGGARGEVITEFADPLTGSIEGVEGVSPSRQPGEDVFLGLVPE